MCGATPSASTASSHARSLSTDTRWQASQASGFHQNKARTTAACTCHAQSPRLMCASSWPRTMRIRSSGQSRASAGISRRGRRQPHVASRSPRGLSCSRTSRVTPAARVDAVSAMFHEGRSTGRARRVATANRIVEASRLPSRSAAPRAQSVTATVVQLTLASGVVGRRAATTPACSAADSVLGLAASRAGAGGATCDGIRAAMRERPGRGTATAGSSRPSGAMSGAIVSATTSTAWRRAGARRRSTTHISRPTASTREPRTAMSSSSVTALLPSHDE